MEIKVEGKRTKEYVKEYVHINSNRSEILKNPYYNINVEKRTNLKITILFSVFSIWGICNIISNFLKAEFSLSTLIITILCTILAVILWICIFLEKSQVKKLLEEERNNIITLDKNGISININSTIMTMPWKTMYFAKIFNESIVFFNSETMIMIEKQYTSDIIKYLNENNIEITIYGLHQNTEVKKYKKDKNIEVRKDEEIKND